MRCIDPRTTVGHRKAGDFLYASLPDVIEYDLKFGRTLPEYSTIDDGQLPDEGAVIDGFSLHGYPRWAAVWPTSTTGDFDCSLHRSLASAEAARAAGVAAMGVSA